MSARTTHTEPNEALGRRKGRPLTTRAAHAMREVDMAIDLGPHMRQTEASRCTTACTTIKCNCPRLVKPHVIIVCKLHCLAAACEHMRRSCCPRRVESEVFMRACMSQCSQAYLSHRARTASTKRASLRSSTNFAAAALKRCSSSLRRRMLLLFNAATDRRGTFVRDRVVSCPSPG